ncbi:MAG TPA: hypothetical protein VK427_06915 [Kofleriaceae bacterium]|nr:hypothetical protein [Kofleriaceae bacterium]
MIAVCFTLSLAQAADARRMPPPEPPAVLTVDVKLKHEHPGLASSRFALAADGRWTFVEIIDGATTKRASGVVRRRAVRTIEQALSRARWRSTESEIRCFAEAMTFTEYASARGVVWQEEMCSGRKLDARSRRELAKITAIVEPLIASAR